MSNEELAVRIQAGELSYLPELWEQTKKWIAASYKRMLRNSTANQDRFNRSGVTLDDLQQEGYFALLEAVDAYKAGAGYQFITYLRYPIMNRYFSAIGLRTAKGKNDLLTASVSLDNLISEDDSETTLADTIADENSLTAFENILDNARKEQLHRVLEYCLKRLEPELEQAIRERYYENKTMGQIAEPRGITAMQARHLVDRGIHRLRHPRCATLLRPFVTDTDTPANQRDLNIYQTGLQSFRNNRVSSVEQAVEQIEQYSII